MWVTEWFKSKICPSYDIIFIKNIRGLQYNYTYKLILPDTTYLYTGGQVSLVRNTNNNTAFYNFPDGVDDCTFSDMIDPQYGFIYSTQENIINWGN